MRPIAHNHDAEATAADIAEAINRIHPQLDLRCLRCEFKSFAEGVKAHAEELARSSDMDELRLFLSTVHDCRLGLYGAEAPASQRLWDLERWERHNTLWMGGESL